MCETEQPLFFFTDSWIALTEQPQANLSDWKNDLNLHEHRFITSGGWFCIKLMVVIENNVAAAGHIAFGQMALSSSATTNRCQAKNRGIVHGLSCN